METLRHEVLSNVGWAAALALAAALAGPLFRQRPALIHGLWVLVLLKLVTPSLVRLTATWDAGLGTVEHTAPRLPAEIPRAAPLLVQPADKVPVPAEVSATRPARVQSERRERTTTRSWPWPMTAVVLWLAGVAAWWLAVGLQVHRFRRLLQAARQAPETLIARTTRLSARLGLRHGPGIWMVPAAVPPMIWAPIGPPRLLLPERLWERLDEPQQDTVLIHELAHLRRRDHWVRRLEAVVVGVVLVEPCRLVGPPPGRAGRGTMLRFLGSLGLAGSRRGVCRGARGNGGLSVRPAHALAHRGHRRGPGPPVTEEAEHDPAPIPRFTRWHDWLRGPHCCSERHPCCSCPPGHRAARPNRLGRPAPLKRPYLLYLQARRRQRPKAAASSPEQQTGTEPPGHAPAPAAEWKVQVSQPIVREVIDYETFNGRVDAAQMIEIRARVGGTLVKVHFQAEQTVENGSPLFEIDPRPYRLELEKAEAEVQRSEVQLKKRSAQLEMTKRLRANKSVSQQEVDLYEADRDESQASLRMAQATCDLAKLKLEFTTITAPIRGKLSRPRLGEGSLVAADTTVLATIETSDPMYVIFDVPENTVLKLARARARVIEGRLVVGTPCHDRPG